MKKIRVAYLHRPGRPEKNKDGWWAYDVPEFSVIHYDLGKYDTFSLDDVKRICDVVIQEDRRLRTEYVGNGPPVCYHMRSITEEWPKRYYDKFDYIPGKGFSLLLEDCLPLGLFVKFGIPVRRFNYCVNDRLFKDTDQNRDIDISCLLRFDDNKRRALKLWLEKFCKDHGYSYVIRSVYPIENYIDVLNRSKVTINLTKPRDRNYRVFEAMACGACLVTSVLPNVSGEYRIAGEHYVEFWDTDDLGPILEYLIEGDMWNRYSNMGHSLIQKYHTWATRASELHQTLCGTIL